MLSFSQTFSSLLITVLLHLDPSSTVTTAVNALGLNLFQKYKYKSKTKSSESSPGKSYPDAASACCACFHSKYNIPTSDGSGFKQNIDNLNANQQTCDTCYVFDRYAIKGSSTNSKDQDLPFETIDTKQESVSEYHWNCVTGKVSENMHDWVNGPIEGEPVVRNMFELCEENPGFYCHGGKSDIMKEPGNGESVEVKKGSNSGTVAKPETEVVIIDRLPEVGDELPAAADEAAIVVPEAVVEPVKPKSVPEMVVGTSVTVPNTAVAPVPVSSVSAKAAPLSIAPSSKAISVSEESESSVPISLAPMPKPITLKIPTGPGIPKLIIAEDGENSVSPSSLCQCSGNYPGCGHNSMHGAGEGRTSMYLEGPHDSDWLGRKNIFVSMMKMNKFECLKNCSSNSNGSGDSDPGCDCEWGGNSGDEGNCETQPNTGGGGMPMMGGSGSSGGGMGGMGTGGPGVMMIR